METLNAFEVSWVLEIQPQGFAAAVCQPSVPLGEGSLARTDADSAGRPKMKGAVGWGVGSTLGWKENVTSCEGMLLRKRRKAAPAHTPGGSEPFRFPHLEAKLKLL